MSSRLSLALVASLALAGCDQINKESAQTDDATNPNYKQAQQDLDNNNPSGAIADYEAALAADPKLAGAHYELGVIYGDKMNDPVSSIYHFKRFIDLSPNSDKKDQVQALIDKESTVFAASLPNTPAASADDVAKLQADNATLKKQVDDAAETIAKLQAQLSKRQEVAATAAPTAEAGSPAATEAPGPAVASDSGSPTPAVPADGTATAAPVTPPRALPVDPSVAAAGNADSDTGGTNGAPVDLANARSYKVVSGDSYWKIAKKMYPGDTKNGVAKIQEANKQTMGKPLKIGQVLVIPK
jgi:LysM repeat protein